MMIRLQLLLGVILLTIVICKGQTNLDSLKSRLREQLASEERTHIISSIALQHFMASQYDSLGKYADALIQEGKYTDNERVQLLGDVFKSQSFLRTDSTKFFQLSLKALANSEDQNFVKGISIVTLGLGSRLRVLGQYQNALKYLNQGASAIKETDLDLISIKSDLIRTISAVYHHQGNYTEALDYGLQSSRLAEQSKSSIQILKSYLNLSGLYGELSSPDNALVSEADRKRYHQEAKKYMMKTYYLSQYNASKLTQGAAAFNLGSLFTEDKQYDSARLFLDEAIALGLATNFHELLSSAYRAKSILYENQPAMAIDLLKKAFDEANLAKNPMLKVATSLDEAKYLLKQKKFSDAQLLIQTALEEAINLNLLNEQREGYFLLYELKMLQRDFEGALKNYTLYVSMKDSIVNEKNFAKLEDLKTKYETELKDAEIKNLEQLSTLQNLEIRQKNFLLISVIFILLSVAVFIWLFYRQLHFRQQKHFLEIENRFLRFQLDPHFISNALVSIQLFMLKNNSQEAASYLSKFSRMMRQLLKYSREEVITIEEEIDMLKNYLDLQKLRLKNKFDYVFIVDDKLSLADSKIPPMFAQPFVENAIEHGISKIENGKIQIEFFEAGGKLAIKIQDNGVGVSDSEPEKKNSYSKKIMRERIELLNRHNINKIQLSIEPLPTGSGTAVKLILPIYS